MALSFKQLTMRNFMSFGNNITEVDLTKPGCTHILGENLDTGSANGVGKSTILNAISYALFNKALSNVSKERLINRTNASKNTEMEVVLTVDKDGTEYEISRARGSAYGIRIIKDNDYENPITPDSVANADKKIQEIVGISYDMFKRTVVFSGGDQSFFEQSVSVQRNTIEELLKITELSEKAVALKKDIQDVDKAIDIQEAVIKQQEQSKRLHERHVAEAENRTVKWESDRITQIDQIKATLESIEGVDFESEQVLHDRKTEILAEKTEKENQVGSITRSVSRESKTLIKLENELEALHDNTCPYCNQAYANSDEKKAEIEQSVEEIKTKLGTLDIDLGKWNKELTDIVEEIGTLNEKIKYDNINVLIETKANSENLADKVTELESAINPHLEAFDALSNEDGVTVDYSGVDELRVELEHMKFLLKLLTDKNSFIRKKIINRNIPFLNKQMQSYIQDLGLPHIVKFTPDMKVIISEHGRELDYGNLSGGEKKRLNLALSLAFRDVMQHLHSKINVLFTDEIDGGSVDSSGVENIIKIIKLKTIEDGISCYIISHRPEITGRFDRELKIIKENGFSRIGESE